MMIVGVFPNQITGECQFSTLSTIAMSLKRGHHCGFLEGIDEQEKSRS